MSELIKWLFPEKQSLHFALYILLLQGLYIGNSCKSWKKEKLKSLCVGKLIFFFGSSISFHKSPFWDPSNLYK